MQEPRGKVAVIKGGKGGASESGFATAEAPAREGIAPLADPASVSHLVHDGMVLLGDDLWVASVRPHPEFRVRRTLRKGCG